MQSIIVVVADLPTRIEWFEKNYPHCELAWFKNMKEFLEVFPAMERSGRLQVIVTEESFTQPTAAMVLGPTQLSMGYSDADIRMLIDNALTVVSLPAVAYA
jgi:hypothetical protein